MRFLDKLRASAGWFAAGWFAADWFAADWARGRLGSRPTGLAHA